MCDLSHRIANESGHEAVTSITVSFYNSSFRPIFLSSTDLFNCSLYTSLSDREKCLQSGVNGGIEL